MIKFKLSEGAKLPKRSTPLAAGLDICTTETFYLLAGERKLVSTGVTLSSCPIGSYLRIAPRSKLANRFGIDVLAGVVDSDYRGEIKVILHNTGESPITLNSGDAIAQLIVESITLCEVQETDSVTETLRGKSGINDNDLRL